MKRFITDPLIISMIAMVSLFVAMIVLIIGLPVKNSTSFYEIPEWGKYTCVTNTKWFGKNKTKECWLLTAEPKMIEFIGTYNKQK